MVRFETFEQRKLFWTFIVVAFFFRLWVGLCGEFRPGDERQIYLIGLKFYTTGTWPYFGPDVTYPSLAELGIRAQVPGALQGLVVGLPFHVLPIAEAPYILLNALSFASLCLLAWYCVRRFPEMPKWFIWVWLLTAPWTLNYSTQINNLSYLLPGSILFFVGALETFPALSKQLIPLGWANFLMGISLFWVMQFHLSWVLLPPFVIASFYFQKRNSDIRALGSVLYFVCGAALTGIFLIPTFLKYGLGSGLGGTQRVIQINLENATKLFEIPIRFLAFASYIVFEARFVGRNLAENIGFLKAQPWVIPLAVFISITGILQIILMIIMWFRKRSKHKDWPAIKYLTLFTVTLIYVSFLFFIRKPYIDKFYITLPIAMIYSFYCWTGFLQKRHWQNFAKVFLLCGVIFQICLGIHNLANRSLYMDRSLVQSAIDSKDYRILDERRPQSR